MAISARTKLVHILQGNDMQQLDELTRAVAVAEEVEKRRPNRRAGGDAGLVAARKARSEFLTEASERAVTVTLRALSGRHWRDLIVEHPPRTESRTFDGEETEVLHAEDSPFGVNTRTFPQAILTYIAADRADMRTIVEISDPDLSTSDLSWLDDIAHGEYERLWTTAFHLNAGGGVDPKALLGS